MKYGGQLLSDEGLRGDIIVQNSQSPLLKRLQSILLASESIFLVWYVLREAKS